MNVYMSRSFMEYAQEKITFGEARNICDPLVINLDSNIASVSDQTFFFDLDADGKKDEMNALSGGSGFLALDKNGDGIINDGNELFGTQSGDGFRDLSMYDSDHNGWIDEADEIFSKLKVWFVDGKGKNGLISIKEAGIGAICLQNQNTAFSLMGRSGGGTPNAYIRKTGVFLYENGMAGTIQHLDMVKH